MHARRGQRRAWGVPLYPSPPSSFETEFRLRNMPEPGARMADTSPGALLCLPSLQAWGTDVCGAAQPRTWRLSLPPSLFVFFGDRFSLHPWLGRHVDQAGLKPRDLPASAPEGCVPHGACATTPRLLFYSVGSASGHLFIFSVPLPYISPPVLTEVQNFLKYNPPTKFREPLNG